MLFARNGSSSSNNLVVTSAPSSSKSSCLRGSCLPRPSSKTLCPESVNEFVTGQSEFSPSFKQDGYFLGSTYALPVGERAVVTLNFALAALDGRYDSRRSVVLKAVDSEGNILNGSDGKPLEKNIDEGTVHSGDTIGLSFGASWKGRIGERIGYSFGADGYSYDFDNKSSENPFYFADLSEKVLRFSGGISYQF